MELDENLIDAHWTKDDNGKPQFFIINEAIISKLCILGENYEPCFEGAQISKFSLDDNFREELFSMMKEMKEILNEGGAPVFTTYAVEIGDSLWTALYDYLVGHYPDKECEFCSAYRIEGIYEEDGQKFAILQNRTSMDYFRLNFSITEEGFSASEELIAVEKEFVPVAEPQFALDAYENYVSEYAANKKSDDNDDKEVCEKCGKPVDECECEDEDKKDKYVLEEIPEYMELSQNYSALQADYNTLNEQVATLTTTNAALEEQVKDLTAFKLQIERKEKEAMINETFYMLSPEDKQEVIDNIDTYSLGDIEAKLATICFRNKISFSKEEVEETAVVAPVIYNLDEVNQGDNSVPAWVKAVLDKQKNM